MNLKLKSHKQIGFGNRVYTVLEDYVFNQYNIQKGLVTDGGSVPKIFIIGLFLILNGVYNFHWLTNVIIFAIAIDESSGWFQKPFFAHDQRWQNAKSWADFFKSNWLFHKDIIFQVNNYTNDYFIKAFFHMTLGYLLAVIYPLAVTIFGVLVFYFKYAKDFKR